MDICKICLEEIEDYESVYSPCNCRGNLNYIHISCFNKAYVAQNKTKCEICKINFPIWSTKNTYLIVPNNQNNDYQFIPREISNFQTHFLIKLRETIYHLIRFSLDIFYWCLLCFFYIKVIKIISNYVEIIFFNHTDID